jgi:hypothetical protein
LLKEPHENELEHDDTSQSIYPYCPSPYSEPVISLNLDKDFQLLSYIVYHSTSSSENNYVRFLLLEIEAESAVSTAGYIGRGRRRFVAVGSIRNSKWRDRGCTIEMK